MIFLLVKKLFLAGVYILRLCSILFCKSLGKSESGANMKAISREGGKGGGVARGPGWSRIGMSPLIE